MKKLAFLIVIVLCLSLCACEPAPEVPAAPTEPAEPVLLNVQITAGKIEPGMTAKDVLVEVTIDHQPVACRVELTCFTDTGYYVMAEDEAVPENFFGRLDVYYSLPKGKTVDDIDVTMTCDGGEYDGTGSVGNDAQGNEETWSHAIYGEDATTQEQQPIETHIHTWVEDPGKYKPVTCTTDGSKTYNCQCGETWVEKLPATGHDWKVGAERKPTCTEPGSQSKTCKNCGAGLLDSKPATGHSWSAWEYSTGQVHKRSCSSCGAEEEEQHTVPSGTVKCTGCGYDIVN